MLQKSSIDGVQFPYHKIKFQLYAPKRQWGPVGVREMRQSPLFSGGCIGVYTSGKEGARVRDSVGLLRRFRLHFARRIGASYTALTSKRKAVTFAGGGA